MSNLCVLLVSLVMFCGCSVHSSQLSDAANCFTLNLYKTLAKKETNLISSPFSADTLLSLLLTASAGSTRSQLQSALGYDEVGLGISDLKNEFNSTIASLVSSDGNILEVANSMWFQNSVILKSDFYETANNYFRAYVDGSLEFKGNPKNATDTINAWAKMKTHGLIEKIFDETLPNDTLLVLVNALYFKGNWAKKFNTRDTFLQNFYNNGNQAKSVPMMNQKQSFPWKYDSSLDAQVLEMNYKGDQISMVFVRPDDSSTLDALEKNLDCKSFPNSYEGMSEEIVQVSVPKFTVSSNLDLKNPLKAVGITDIFGGNADLSGIADVDFNLNVGDVVQKALVKIDEEGSEAAAVTAARICRACSAVIDTTKDFRLNRPFLFFIRHKQTGLILFVGRVSSL